MARTELTKEELNNLPDEERYYYWECNTCGNVHRSDPYQRWHMENCPCGNSGIDLEIHYMRGYGQTTKITKEQYDNKLKQQIENEKTIHKGDKGEPT